MHFLFLKYLNSAQLALQDFIQYTAARVCETWTQLHF